MRAVCDQSATPTLSMVEIIQGIQGQDTAMWFPATQSARRLLSRERNPPIDDIVDAGILPRLVTFLDHSDRYTLAPFRT